MYYYSHLPFFLATTLIVVVELDDIWVKARTWQLYVLPGSIPAVISMVVLLVRLSLKLLLQKTA